MSRSRKKVPIHGNTCSESEKKDKTLAHRRLRRMVREAIISEDDVMPDENDASDPWSYSKDGKHYWKGHSDTPQYRRRMK